MTGIYVRVRRNPSIAPIPDIPITWNARWQSHYGVWGIVFLFLLVIGGIYSGFSAQL